MITTLPRIQHEDSIVGYGWRLNDACYPEAKFSIENLVFHADDLHIVRGYYQKKIDAIQAQALNEIIGADLYRYIVYILKFLELMSVELGLRTIDESVILSHEADEDGKAALAATWSQKSTAWLHVVGISEREASKAKSAIADCDNDADMKTIVDEFSDKLSEALND